MKIQITGYSGCGKSTLAKAFALHYNIPLLYLDTVQFYDDWQERPKEKQNQIVTQFIEENNDWVIDGNYYKVAPQRFEKCDLYIFLNYNRFYCFIQCLLRYLKNKGQSRESCPCEEKFDHEFRSWILKDGRTQAMKEKHLRHFDEMQCKKYQFKSRRQLKRYLKQKKIKYPV